MDIIDVFGIILLLIAAAICVAISLYIYVYLAEPAEKDVPGVWMIRSLIISGLALTLFVILLVPVDIISNFQA